MQSSIHPTWYTDAKVSCACGNTFTTGSTLSEIQVDICYNCHPFFTGEMKFVDRLGRVDKFKQKQQAAGTLARGGKKARLAKKQQSTDSQKNISSFKDILQNQRKAT